MDPRSAIGVHLWHERLSDALAGQLRARKIHARQGTDHRRRARDDLDGRRPGHEDHPGTKGTAVRDRSPGPGAGGNRKPVGALERRLLVHDHLPAQIRGGRLAPRVAYGRQDVFQALSPRASGWTVVAERPPVTYRSKNRPSGPRFTTEVPATVAS